MLICTYKVLIHNNQSNISALVDSLKKMEGNFRKEFIFVDDGSVDDSLAVLKNSTNTLPRTTIITQENQGPAISINKASSLAMGDYIHFVEGDEILHRQSTAILVEACLSLGTQVALGAVSPNPLGNAELDCTSSIIESPLKELLINKIPNIRNIGGSGSLVHRVLLEKIGGADNSIYTQIFSLALKCAKFSKFAYIDSDISTISDRSQNLDEKFTAYNNLKSIYNFVQDNPRLFDGLIPELLSVLSHENLASPKKINYLLKSFVSSYAKSTTVEKILKFYGQEIERLF